MCAAAEYVAKLVNMYTTIYLLIQTSLLFCTVFIQEAAIEIGVLKTNKEEFLCVTSTNNVVIFPTKSESFTLIEFNNHDIYIICKDKLYL